MPRSPHRVFLLSPARAGGVRMSLLFNPNAGFQLAHDFQARGAKVGELFQFASGLYFRGKLAYARAYARPPKGCAGALAILPGRGLLGCEEPLTVKELQAIAEIPVDLRDRRYREPLERDALALRNALAPDAEVVLLGSIATGKYSDLLLEIFGDRLLFPPDFVGRGDMSRGGLLLRCVRSGQELRYEPLRGAVRHGKRPPRLGPPEKAATAERLEEARTRRRA